MHAAGLYGIVHGHQNILRGQRVIVPEPDEPLEGGDELLLVAAPEVEDQLRELLLPG